MPASAQPFPEPASGESADALARIGAPGLSPIIPVGGLEGSPAILPFAGAPRLKNAAPGEAPGRKSEGKILRGLKDLQNLQKQTIAVLEAVQGSLDDIQQVLRSPEATRGLEKQKNAATLLAKGFPREAVEQASGAAMLLPANPEAHLLLALSLAADQQLDASLAATRKGLALIDRRNHPLAIEAGLLHALAALGCAAEAIDRWSVIIDSLPLPVLLEQSARIAACFPSTPAPAAAQGADETPSESAAEPHESHESHGHLDNLLAARLSLRRADDHQAAEPGHAKSATRRSRLIDTAPDEIPANALFAGLDAAAEAGLPLTHRAILVQIAHRLRSQRTSADILKFLSECVVPLGNSGLDRVAASMGLGAVRRLWRHHADAPTLFRAMEKLQLAGALYPARKIAKVLEHWRKAGRRISRARHGLVIAPLLFVAGLVLAGWALGWQGNFSLGVSWLNPLYVGTALMAGGLLTWVFVLLLPTWNIYLPEGRPPLSAAEIAYLRPAAMRHALHGMLYATRSASSRLRAKAQANPPYQNP